MKKKIKPDVKKDIQDFFKPMSLSRLQKISNWFRENWRSLAFLTYCTICVFDFIVMPVVYQIFNNAVDPAALLAMVQQLKDPNVQLEFLRLYGTKTAWVPITMGAGGTFHLAFGGILTAAGWTRGNEKIAMINQGIGAASTTPDNPDAPK